LGLLIFHIQGHMVLVTENLALYVYLFPLWILELGRFLMKGLVALLKVFLPNETTF
jgi:hypothetical protein